MVAASTGGDLAIPTEMGLEHRERLLTHGRGEERSRLRVDAVGQCLLVSVGRTRRRGSLVAHTLPAEEGRVAVIVPDPVTTLMPELVRQLWQWVPVVWDSVRLVMADAGSPGENSRPPAQEMSELLGVEVIAPEGRLLAVPGGSLFVVGRRRNGGRGGWTRFRPGRPPETVGKRYPEPEWERDMVGFTDPGIEGVVVDEVPAGLWMRWAGKVRVTDLSFAVPVNSSSMALLVSRAGDPPLRNADVRRLVGALPETLYDQLAVVPYGDHPIAGAPLGAVVSLAANRTLPVRTGLPLHRYGAGVQVVAVGRDRLPAWSPFARSMAWRPHGGPRLLNWTVPAGQLLPVGPGQFQLNERWLVEIIEAGLWLREIDKAGGAAIVRQLSIRSKYCAVVVGALDADHARPPWRAIVKLIKQLPDDARDRLRIVVPQAAGEKAVRNTARACQRVLAGSPVYVLTRDGQLVRLADSGQQVRDRRHEPLSRPRGLRLAVEFPGLDGRRSGDPVERRRRTSDQGTVEPPAPRPGARRGSEPEDPREARDPAAQRTGKPSAEPAPVPPGLSATRRPIPPATAAVPDRVVRDERTHSNTS